ncbi:unnamed protein product [Blepharisma stoltei]|uniref:HTH La-type RNA-binding domain-containing protein n=1 Tax=Blepharisma stoltei TaxID=1481888 RepID=A0AAU9K9Y0_9CILI|nr:unnamed protein product [Blepharisma stoltei]
MGSSSSKDLKPSIESTLHEFSVEALSKSNLPALIDSFLEKSHISITKDQLIAISDNELPPEFSLQDLFSLHSKLSSLPSNKLNLQAIKLQIEYYFSDSNLRRDKFFRELIEKSVEGYIQISDLLKCKRLIQLNANDQLIREAAECSSELEISPDGSGVRRNGNRKIPKKIIKATKNREIIEPSPIILSVEVLEESKGSWKQLRDSFKQKHKDIEVIYCRFSGKEGNIGINGSTSEEEIGKILYEDLEFEGQSARIWKLEGDSLLDFWKLHGSHFDLCNNQSKNIKKSKAINIGGRFFYSTEKLKEFLKELLERTPEGQNIDPQYHNFLHALLRHHPSYESKSIGLKTFSTGMSEIVNSKSFFIVKEDGSQQEFNISKCLSSLN